MKCLKFATKEEAENKIASIESRVSHGPSWKYSTPFELKAGGWIVEIVDSIIQFLTPEEIGSQLDFEWSDIVEPPTPLP